MSGFDLLSVLIASKDKYLTPSLFIVLSRNTDSGTRTTLDDGTPTTHDDNMAKDSQAPSGLRSVIVHYVYSTVSSLLFRVAYAM